MFAPNSVRFASVALIAVVCSVKLSVGQDLPLVEAKRGPLTISTEAIGQVNYVKAFEVRSQVESFADPVTIQWVIDEGARVKEGDLLVVLSAPGLKEALSVARLELQAARAETAQAEGELRARQMAAKEYREGRIPLEEYALETELMAAKLKLKQTQRGLNEANSQDGVDPEKLSDIEATVALAERQVRLAEKKQEVFQTLTKPRLLQNSEKEITTAEAGLAARMERLKLSQSRVKELELQLASCRIIAEASGVVLMPPSGRRGENLIEEGATVRPNQRLLRVCQTQECNVTCRIHESMIENVKVGMTVTVQVAALGEDRLQGEVLEVGSVPLPVSWMTPDLKEYEVVVGLPPNEFNLREGMTARVEMVAAELHDVIYVPLESVIDVGGQGFCLLRVEGGWMPHPVELGFANQDHVVIKEGLAEFEEIARLPPRQMLNPNELLRRLPKEPRDDPGVTGAPQAVERMFSNIDLNKNGLLEFGEIPATIRKQMQAFDTNQDEALDEAELKQALQKMRKR